MKITFPHMGNTFIAAKVLMDSLGLDYIVPPPVSRRDLEIGVKYCPEMACIPLKINIGNFVQAIERGADTILMIGGFGPCRLGYYGEMHREILHDNGYNVDVIVLEVSRGEVREFLVKLKRLTGNSSYIRLINAIKNAVSVSSKVDELEKRTFITRPREKNKGDTDRIYNSFLEEVVKTKGYRNIQTLIQDTINRLLQIELVEGYKPLRIGIVGEIYSIIEPFTNMNLERTLGGMGIEVDRSLTVSKWISEHIVRKVLFLKKDDAFKKAAMPYLGAMIGGHAQETIGNSVLYSKDGYDGIIQLYPLTCMPEIVADSILPTVSRDKGIPVLTLVVDEMTGEEGFKTRLEAFTDLLESRRERCKIDNRAVLPRG